jgi:hypothetical protein
MKTVFKFTCLFILTLVLFGCSATKLVQQSKSDDSYNFQANKVLIVGISADKDIRRLYEKKMVESLEKENVIAVKSVDFFEASFTDNKKSLEQLNTIEGKLLEAGFDAIIFSKITSQENRVTIVDAYRNFSKNNQSYEDYYYHNQHLYFKEKEEPYQVYNTETSLFCICPGKDRELLWRGEIEIVDTKMVTRNINNYIKILFKSLKENNILLLEE